MEHGFDAQEVIKRAHGRPSLTTIREYLPNADHDLENREVERREMTDLEGVKLLPGASELLFALPAGSWTIVTSSTRPLAEVRLRAVGLPLPVHMVTSSDVSKGKPDPEPYLTAAAVLGVAAQDCLVAEDTPAGIVSGKRAGARVIAFRTTYPDSELVLTGPNWIVNDCKSITVVRIDRAGHSISVALKDSSSG